MLSNTKLAKIEKVLQKDELSELEAKNETELRLAISNSAASIKEAQDELDANEKYQELKESLKALSEGLRDVKKRQNAIIQYCLSLLEDKGNAS